MSAYLIPLVSLIVLCALWAIFQLWLQRHDPDSDKRSLKCGACERRHDCDAESSSP